MKRAAQKWEAGAAVTVAFADGNRVQGQVWSRANRKGYVWVALEDGCYVAVFTRTGRAKAHPAAANEVGKVAA